jgi:hypothetical protein
MSSEIYWVAVSSVEIGALESMLLMGVMNIYSFQILCPIWVTFGVRDQGVPLLSVVIFVEMLAGKAGTVRMDVNIVTFTRLLWNRVIFRK